MRGGRWSLRAARSRAHVPVHVLVVEVARGGGAGREVGLRNVGPHPDEVPGLDLVPAVAEVVDALAFEHVEAVLHEVRLGNRERVSGREREDVHRHVVRDIRRKQRLEQQLMHAHERLALHLPLVPEHIGGAALIEWLVDLLEPDQATLRRRAELEARARMEVREAAGAERMGAAEVELALARDRVEERLYVLWKGVRAPAAGSEIEQVHREARAHRGRSEHARSRARPLREHALRNPLGWKDRVVALHHRPVSHQPLLWHSGPSVAPPRIPASFRLHSGARPREKPMDTVLDSRNTRELLHRLSGANRRFAEAYPGDRADRQPVHTADGGAHLFSAAITPSLRAAAYAALRHPVPDPR